MRTERAGLLAALLVALPGIAAAQEFQVTLDDRPIGTHRFTLGGPPQARTVRSVAAFEVKLLGLVVYRYRHQASEQWRGDCLVALDAETDDDGKPGTVHAATVSQALEVAGPAGTLQLKGCVMSFAYWHPAMRTQAQLLNAQTGAYEAVDVRRLGGGQLEVRGQPMAAEHWRIEGPVHPVDVWYTAAGEWVGLDSTVRGGRQLRYRLR